MDRKVSLSLVPLKDCRFQNVIKELNQNSKTTLLTY